MLRDLNEGVLYVVSSLSRSLEEQHAELAGQGLPLLGADDLLVDLIDFVSDQHFLYILAGMQIYLAHPIANIIERLLACAIISKDNAHGALVISLSDSAEALLPRCVPDLQLHILAVNLDCFYLKVDTYWRKLIRNVGDRQSELDKRWNITPIPIE
jgi:hypothetical protein